MTVTYRRKEPQYRLYLGWARQEGEAGAFVDMPRRCWSQLEARRIWLDMRRRLQARGLRIWFARVGFPDGESAWLEDNRGKLRNGNGHR